MFSTIIDDERRPSIGLSDRDCCRVCHEPVTRTDASGLCWRCMPSTTV